MTHPEEDLDARLERLAHATEAIRPSRGFTSRVMGAVGSPSPSGWLEGLRASSFRLLPMAALAAALAVVWAARSQASVDDALAVSYGSVDLDGE